jgi:pimeloyl-ACP methyl ester carboxylesterase
VIVLNRPGGGLSEGMDHTTIGLGDLACYTLATVLDSLDIDRVPIVAHSMGGHWSQWFAMDRPDRVTALALLGVPGNVLTTRPPLALRLASVHGLNRLVVRATIPRRTQDALKGLGFPGSLTGDSQTATRCDGGVLLHLRSAPELPDVDPDPHEGDEPAPRIEPPDRPCAQRGRDRVPVGGRPGAQPASQRPGVDAAHGPRDPGQSPLHRAAGMEPPAHRHRPGRPGQHRARAPPGRAVEPARGLGHLHPPRASGHHQRGRLHRRPGPVPQARPG